MKKSQAVLLIFVVFSFRALAQNQNLDNIYPNGNSSAGLNPFKIVYFGSSVPYGQGATNKNGYTNIYTKILTDRLKNGGYPWETMNISIPGDNTIKVLNRYNRDLIPQKAKYVIFALALGNEGIHENGKPAFDQFKQNIKLLIAKARADGLTPVITNSYTRNDYNALDYKYNKELNLFIHLLDIPSINLLGAVDDLSGHWTDGYWDDGFHPNDKGHLEMAYTLVPSLFDALHDEKPLPKTIESSSVLLRQRKNTVLNFSPENIVHPFTVAFSFNSSYSGNLLTLEGEHGLSTVWAENGVLKYTSPNGETIISKMLINDKKWHKVILTHYYAKGLTTLYCDSTVQGELKEQLAINNLKIGGSIMPKKVFYKDLMFWRSGMNAEEAKYIARDSLLKSSLELYAPLNGKKKKLSKTNMINLAQSNNKIKLSE